MKRFIASLVGSLTALIIFSSVAQAQSLVVATGDPKLTYSTMFKELSGRCQSVSLREVNSNGSNANLDMLEQNKVNAAIVQTDALFWRSRSEDDLNNVRTLFTLYPEEVHFVARADGVHEGGVSLGGFSIGGKQVIFNNIGDLNGHNVGAVGGSALTAEVIKALTKINYNIVKFSSNDEASKALQAGNIDAFIAVGGAPLSTVANLDQRFKLLMITPQQQGILAKVYKPARVSYGNLGQRGVPTVATEALMVSRVYSSAQMLDGLKRFRQCEVQALPDLKDTVGTHPKWQVVEAGNKGLWTYYDFK
jgi:TRAP-type uncharacterized transport system substrate-binding protein